jgi:3-oxoacyl-[acyl-carrier protein] reductase
MQLEGKVALVTGSGRNIGRSIALSLAREGVDVVVNARTNREDAKAVADEVRGLGRKSLPLLADVGNRTELEQLLETALAEFGRLDIVVNNASVRPNKAFTEMSYDDWRGVLATDLDSAFITSRAAVPGMVERGWGRIINLGGLQAHQGRHGGAHISAAKVGLVGFTRALSTELGPQGIRVNCVVPGMIDTSREGASTPRTGNRLADIPAGRMGHTDDIASLCTFLCTDAADYISGQTIHVNGGERTFGG